MIFELFLFVMAVVVAHAQVLLVTTVVGSLYTSVSDVALATLDLSLRRTTTKCEVLIITTAEFAPVLEQHLHTRPYSFVWQACSVVWIRQHDALNRSPLSEIEHELLWAKAVEANRPLLKSLILKMTELSPPVVKSWHVDCDIPCVS